MKKLIAAMLVLIMVLAVVPTAAFAAEALNTGGYGTFSYEKGKRDVTLEVYLDDTKVFSEVKDIKSVATSPSFKASEGYFIKKVEISNGTWGTASSALSPSPKSKEYSGVLTLHLGNPTIKLYLVKSCKLTVEYQYTDKSAGNSDIKKYQGYTREIYPGEEFKSNEWNYYDEKDVREYYTSSVKDGNGNDVNVKGTAITGRYFNGTITEDATYTVTFAPANTKDFLEINSYEGRGVIGNNMNADFRYYGYEISGENGANKVYIVKDGKLTPDASKNKDNADPSIIIKDGKTYKYVFAGLGGDLAQIKDVYYDSSEQNWYYIYRWVTSFDAIDVSWTNTVGPIRIPATEEGRINFVYKETTNSHILNYDANGGKNAPEKQEEKTSAPSATFTIPQTTPTRDGYDFLGWADDANATKAQYMPGNTITVSGEETIYAVWKKDIGPIPSPDPVALVGNITVKCVNAVENHEEKQTPLIEGSYTVSPIVDNRATVKIKSGEYVKFYNGQVTGVTHTITGDTEKTINIEYNDEQKTWVVVGENATPVVFTVQHDVPMGDNGFVRVKKDFMGLPNGTFPNEALFKVKQGDKEIANIYVNQNNDWGANETTPLSPGEYTVEEIINSEVQVDGYILTKPDAQSFTIEAGQIKEVTFTNEYEETFPGVITVKKTVESNDLADKNKEFNFKVTVITGPNPDPSGPPIAKSANAFKAPAVRAVDKTATNKDFERENGIPTLYFNLKDGDMMTISNLPVGFTYRVEELDADGYTVTVNNETTTSKDVGLTKENPKMTLEFKNTKGSTPTPTPTPYNGGGGYYYPTTTPVPVIVIPPKTGDMTLLQYIARLLGLVR